MKAFCFRMVSSSGLVERGGGGGAIQTKVDIQPGGHQAWGRRRAILLGDD